MRSIPLTGTGRAAPFYYKSGLERPGYFAGAKSAEIGLRLGQWWATRTPARLLTEFNSLPSSGLPPAE